MSRLTDSNKEIPLLINERYWLDVYFKLQEYEDLEEQGLLLKLPCKIGDTIYYIEDNCICEIVIKRITIIDIRKEKEGLFFRINYTVDYELSDFGKTVFLTKEEAEQELKELKRFG